MTRGPEGRRRARARFAAALLAALPAAAARAAFEESGAGARSAGMANAFSAVADDAGALHLNPAGLAQLGRAEFTAMYGRLYLGLSDNSDLSSGFASLAVPVPRWGTLAASWHQTQLSGAYAENAFSLGWGRRVARDVRGGVAVRLLRRSFQSDIYTAVDPLFQSKGFTTSDLSTDLGVLWRPGRYSASFVVLNANAPDVGLASEDRVPREVRLGLGYRVPNTIFGLDLSRRAGDNTAAFGGEFWLMGRFATRAGFEIGSRSRRNLNVGLSYRFSSFQMDYAFHFPFGTIQSTQGSHRFSLTARFGTPAPLERSFFEGEMTPEAQTQLDQLRKDLDAARTSLSNAEERGRKLETTLDVLQEDLRRAPAPSTAPAGPPPEELDRQMKQLLEDQQRQQGETQKLRDQVRQLEAELERSRKGALAAPLPVPVPTPGPGPTPSPATGKPAERAPARPANYTVQEGDTLQSIAEKVYGDPERWMDIYTKNPSKVRRGGQVLPGTVLAIP